MLLDPDDARPTYEQIADDLRAAIVGGTYEVGTRLPSTAQLTRRYGVAAMTARKALDVLRRDGLVVSRQGQGVFVRTRPAERATSPDVAEQLATMADALRQIDRRVSALEERAANEDETGTSRE